MLIDSLSALRRLAVIMCSILSVATSQEVQHFSPKGKPPSKYTIELQQRERQILSFADKRDFDEAKRGFIAAPPYRQIMSDSGGVAWDIE